MEKTLADKLMELKKLHEAGILTKEELETEKQKILNSGVPTENAQQEASSQDTSSATPSPSSPAPKNNNTGLWIGIGVALLVAVVCIIAFSGNKKKNSYEYDDSTYEDSVYVSYDYEDYSDEVQDSYADKVIIDGLNDSYDEPGVQDSQSYHYRVNRYVIVYQGPGDYYDQTTYDVDDSPAEYEKGSIVESTGLIKNGYMFVSHCGCRGGHGDPEDGWILADAVSRMQTCRDCGGTGYDSNRICPECDGEGYGCCTYTGKMQCNVCHGIGAI